MGLKILNLSPPSCNRNNFYKNSTNENIHILKGQVIRAKVFFIPLCNPSQTCRQHAMNKLFQKFM
jgi:hypothetical protein